MKKIILTTMIVFHSFAGYTHEGHDQLPGAGAPHGGVLQDLENIHLELLVDTGGIKLYPYDEALKPLALNEVQIEGTATLPKKTKAEKVVFKSEGAAFSATVDAKGAHRYKLEVTATYKGKKNKAKFNVEPQ